MDKEKCIEFIKRIPLFTDLLPAELEALVPLLKKITLKKGEFIYNQNEERDKGYFIYKGEVELFKEGMDKTPHLLVHLREGEFLSEGALLDNYPHSTSARVVEKADILTLSRDDFLTYLEGHPQSAAKIISQISRIIGRRMRQSTNQVVNAAAPYVSGATRIEHDLLGNREVPAEAYYGIQTHRALENFDITRVSISHYKTLITSLAKVKLAAARANYDLELLEKPLFQAISRACQEIIQGKLHTHFVVDMVQGGAGTSTNMNANEVIANRALVLMGYNKGDYHHCHPNNHVNLSQSTNDSYPTALKIALYYRNQRLIEILKELIGSFQRKAEEFKSVIKMGRTQLQDAVPMTLGQEFEAFGATLEEEILRLEQNSKLFLELNMGGTAIGTGINADPRYSRKVIAHLRKICRIPLELASNLVEATSDTGSFVMYSSAVKRLAVKLSKISNDLRLLSSGPRAGFNEINLPRRQPGSSIMPGKVNPVIPEVMNQIAFKVVGNDLTVTLAAEAGQLQLNVMEPIIAQALFESVEMLKNGMLTLKNRCIDGITANEEVCRRQVENSIGLVTALNPYLGYEKCTAIASEALQSGKSVYQLVLDHGYLSRETLDDLLKPENMIR